MWRARCARDRAQLEPGDRPVAAGLVRVRAAVPVDAAVVRRETNSWRYPLFMALYLFVLAYAGAFITYRVALLLGAGA